MTTVKWCAKKWTSQRSICYNWLVNYQAKKPRLEREMKMVPPDFDLFDHDVARIIYGDNILLIDYNSNSAILIENPTLAHFQRRLFQLLYKLLP